MKRFLAALVCAVVVMTGAACAESLTIGEKIAAIKVQWLSKADFFWYEKGNSYVARFVLTDKDKNEVEAPAEVLLRIEDENENSIYSNTFNLKEDDYVGWTNWLGTKTYASMYISPEEIPETKTGKGTVYLKIKLEGFYEFEEISVEVDGLPKVDVLKDCELTLPEFPKESVYSGFGGIYSKATVNKIDYEFTEDWDGEIRLTLYVTGEKTYDNEGEKNEESCFIKWKLYDEEDYVVESGTLLTSELRVGEKFKDAKEIIYSLKPGKYRLEITAEE